MKRCRSGETGYLLRLGSLCSFHATFFQPSFWGQARGDLSTNLGKQRFFLAVSGLFYFPFTPPLISPAAQSPTPPPNPHPFPRKINLWGEAGRVDLKEPFWINVYINELLTQPPMTLNLEAGELRADRRAVESFIGVLSEETDHLFPSSIRRKKN